MVTAQAHAFPMNGIDWIELVSIAGLLIIAGTLCIVFFAI